MLRVALPLCLHGFFKEYRPSEPFISSYLVGHWKNFTKDEVNQEIYPLGTYMNLGLLVIVFLLTDILRYKPVIIAGGCSAIITWSLLRWGTTLPAMQVLEFFYAFFMASEVAYYTYMYAKVEKKEYQKVTSHTRGAILLGKASAGLSSQLLVYYNALDYEQLNYLTIAGVGMATLCGFALPSVQNSIYFHRDSFSEVNSLSTTELGEKSNLRTLGWREKWTRARQSLYADFLHAFTKMYVLRWSIWWALATCGYLQVTSYSQLLWEEINSDKQSELQNGYVEFGSSIVGASVAIGIGYIHLQWHLVGELFLAIVSLSQGALMVYSAFIDDLISAYAVYIVFVILYQSAITIATSEVAKHIREDSYALVFGVNFFMALVIQTILTAIVIESLELNIRQQFTVYGGYYLLIGCGFGVAGLVNLVFCKPRVR